MRRPLSEEQQARIRQMVAEGNHSKAISDTLGIAHSTAWRYANLIKAQTLIKTEIKEIQEEHYGREN